MKRIFIIISLIVTAIIINVAIILVLYNRGDAFYQHDADIIRLRHLQYFGGLIEECHQKTGKYPLQGKSEYQNYAHVAAPHQQQYIKGNPPQKHVVTDIETFRKELEDGLGRKVDLKFDPQKIPTNAPNFYIYMIEGDRYFFAVHLYGEHPFANPVGRHYNKVEISNKEGKRQGLWKFDALLNDEKFNNVITEKPYKEGFFLNLEEQYK